MDKPHGTGFDNAFGVNVLIMHGGDDDPRARFLGDQPSNEIQSASTLQREVNDGHVGLLVLDASQRTRHIVSLATDFHVSLSVNSGPQAIPHERVVVDQKNSRLGRAFHGMANRSKNNGATRVGLIVNCTGSRRSTF